MANTFTEISQSLALQRAIAGSTGTTARSMHKFDSLGMGSFRLNAAFDFEVKFTEEPLFTSGVIVKPGTPIPPVGMEPNATVGVWKWQREGPLWTGAYVWFAVSQTVVGPSTLQIDEVIATGLRGGGGITYRQAAEKLHLTHHMCFEGFAIRDVDYDAIMKD